MTNDVAPEITDAPAAAALAQLREVLYDDRARHTGQLRALWRMTADERVAAFYRGELTMLQLREWEARRPHELPPATLRPVGGIDAELDHPMPAGELWWITLKTPEFCGD